MPDTTTTAILAELVRVIRARKGADPQRSYTSQLLAGGVEVIGAKVLEEAGELVEAVRTADSPAHRAAVVHEAADLVFHAMVLLESRGVSLDDVLVELGRRFGRPGLEEKGSRSATA